jgi:hypothetical protein
MSLDFKAWPKIPRWKRDIIITEKIDGTNASVWIDRFTREELEDPESQAPNRQHELSVLAEGGKAVELESGDGDVLHYVRAGSRTNFIWPGKDNYGFAAWVWSWAAELTRLGPGSHFGEWYGNKINRAYGMTDRRFALFNTSRWSGQLGDQEPPACCDVVPVLYKGPMTLGHGEDAVDFWLRKLAYAGSEAEGAHGFKQPEGIIIYHVASQNCYKVTIDGDEHKGPQG